MKTVTACHTSRTSAGFVWSCTARVWADPPGRTYLGTRSSSVLTTWRLLHCVSGEWWHVDENSDPHAIRFGQLLDSFGLVQHVCELTHQAGHILELDRHQSYLHGDYCTACQGNDNFDHALTLFLLRLLKAMPAGRGIDCHTTYSHQTLQSLGSVVTMLIFANWSVDNVADLHRRVITYLLDKDVPPLHCTVKSGQQHCLSMLIVVRHIGKHERLKESTWMVSDYDRGS